ncbi:uncharacterized protein LOC111059112, partial [Nilaparvata lugens]|uniref:uncharacterized protein LOC111059112 n=1 Tax=Nilaparvata lugens TaxID=108931 RepID=UPI00193DF1B1
MLKKSIFLVLIPIFSSNVGIVIGGPQVDWLKLIADNVRKSDPGMVPEPLKETSPQAYQDIDEAPKVVGTLLKEPGLLSRLKSNAMELLANDKGNTDGEEVHQDFFNKPIALFDKIKFTVAEEPLKDEENHEATPNQDGNSTSLLEELASSTGKITDIDKDSVRKITENNENLSILEKLESSSAEDHLDRIGNHGKLVELSTNLTAPASNLENIKLEGIEKLTEDIAEDHHAGLGNAGKVLDSSSILKIPLSILRNLKSESFEGFAKDKDLKNGDKSSHINNSLTLFDGMKPLSNETLENVFKAQEIENITSIVGDKSSIVHNSLESSAKQLGLSGDKVDVENSTDFGKHSRLLGNLKDSTDKAVGGTDGLGSSFRIFKDSSGLNFGKPGPGLKDKGEEENGKNENETKEEKPKENINESQNAKKIPTNWDINVNIFDKLKSKEADEEVRQDSYEDDEKNFPKLEESSNEKNIFSLQDLRVFSASDIDFKIGSKMNEQKDDMKNNSTQIDSDDKDV